MQHRARELRHDTTEAEQILWSFLRNRKLSNLKFRHQHHVGNHVLDFYCAEKKLCIELDGSIHELADQKERDKARTALLSARGITVLRFQNSEVQSQIGAVLERIRQAATSPPRPPSP